MAFDSFLKMFGPREQPPEAGGLAAPAPEASGGLGGGMFGGLSRFNESHPGFLMGAGNLIAGRSVDPAIMYALGAKKDKKTAAEQRAVQNKTRAYLLSKGMSETDADAALTNPAILSQLLKQQAGGSEVDYSQVPIYGVDPKTGKTGIGVLGNNGTFKPIDTGGFEVAGGMEKIDAGTHWEIYDRRTNQLVSRIPKENFQEAYDTGAGAAAGKGAAEAAQALPGVAGMAALIDSQIQSLKNDPYLPNMVGPTDSRLPNISGDAARVQSKIDQLQGGAFLQARQMLKGGGAITDIEGQKAEAAFVRMNQAQNDADFVQALDEFNAAVQQGLRKLQGQAGGLPPAAGQPGTRLRYNPQTGELE